MLIGSRRWDNGNRKYATMYLNPPYIPTLLLGIPGHYLHATYPRQYSCTPSSGFLQRPDAQRHFELASTILSRFPSASQTLCSYRNLKVALTPSWDHR
ncbi:hypothetical protein AB1N83_013273 [Pleurotus pulmonarius]